MPQPAASAGSAIKDIARSPDLDSGYFLSGKGRAVAEDTLQRLILMDRQPETEICIVISPDLTRDSSCVDSVAWSV